MNYGQSRTFGFCNVAQPRVTFPTNIAIFIPGANTRLKKKKQKHQDFDSQSSTSSQLSTKTIQNVVDQLKLQQHRDSMKKCYYAVWKSFNNFFIRLDSKPSEWEDRLALFVGYLVNCKKQSSTVKSYISAIKATLKMHGINISEDRYLLTSLTRVCKLRNDVIKHRLPIKKGMLCILLDTIFKQFCGKNQPFLATLYRALFSTAYFGMFRVGELTVGPHAVLAKDVHVGKNKKKLLFLLRTSKTHTKGMPPQMVKISSSTRSVKTLGEHSMNNTLSLPCPF